MFWSKCHGPWDAAVKGSPTITATVITAFRDEVALYNGKNSLIILWDFKTFENSHNIPELIATSNEIGYPIKLTALGLIMHTAPRTIRAYDHHVPLGRPSDGILRGAPKAIILRGYSSMP